MHKLPNIDLENHYYNKFKSTKGIYSRTIGELLYYIEKEDNVIDFKNELLSITQLYFDGLLKRVSENDFENNDALEWSNRSAVLNSLFLAGKKTIGGFYWNGEIDFEEIKKLVLPHSEILADDNSYELAKKRHLDNKESTIQEFGLDLQKRINCEVEVPNKIVCISSGGFEPAYLLMNLVEIDDLVAVRYSRHKREDSKVKTLEKVSSSFSINSNSKSECIWVIDDITANGATLSEVIKYVLKSEPSKVYGISVKGEPIHLFEGSEYLPDIKTSILNRQNPFICRYVLD